MSKTMAKKAPGKVAIKGAKLSKKPMVMAELPPVTGLYGVLPKSKAKMPVVIKPMPAEAGHTVHEPLPAGAVPPVAAETREARLANRLVSEVAGTSTDVGVLCDTYGLRREELGRLTGFSLRALAEWAGGKLPSQPAKRRLQEVRRLLDALGKIVKPESIPAWLHERNAAFDNLTPLQVIEFGETDRLWGMVYDLSAGQPD